MLEKQVDSPKEIVYREWKASNGEYAYQRGSSHIGGKDKWSIMPFIRDFLFGHLKNNINGIGFGKNAFYIKKKEFLSKWIMIFKVFW